MSYRYDDTNPEARTARRVADRALQVAAGRVDPVQVEDDLVAGAGLALHRLPRARPRRHGHHGQRPLGPGVLDRRCAAPQADEAARRDADADSTYYLASFLLWRMALLVFEVGVPGRVRRASRSACRCAARCSSWPSIARSGSLAFSALGLLIASRARTIEGVSGIMNVVMMPMWILSGVFFSADRFPDSAQPFIKALPLTALVDALRANMLQGASIGALGPELGTLAVWLAACFGAAILLFRWR